MTSRLTCAVALAVVVSACSSSGSTSAPASNVSDAASVRASIEAANARFLAAFKGGDKAGMVASYADDAVLMMPNEPAWRGREGIERGLDGFLAQMTFKEGGTTTTDVMVSGDLAVETGTFAWTLQPKSGAEVKDRGKYLTAWKRQVDGSWKVVRDINNSDLPPASH
jgi:uncharacterized protein (TIGR02246 family)